MSKTLIGTLGKKRKMREERTFQIEQPEQRPQGQGSRVNVCGVGRYG